MKKELPPILQGTTQNQIAQLRDYLVRMVNGLDATIQATMSEASSTSSTTSSGEKITGGSAEDIAKVRENAAELRALIIKTANDTGKRIDAESADLEALLNAGDNFVMSYADSKTEALQSIYVAKSEFGTYQETVEAQIEATAKGVVESYNYDESIQSAQDSIDLLQSYYTDINGQIRRGIIEDPDNPGSYVTGIAISQNLQFSGECGADDENNPGDGHTYYYLNSGQTFGLYTSTGWQYWIDGVKKGYFDSVDGMLHVYSIAVDYVIQIGAKWHLRSNNGGEEFEIAYGA